MSELLTRLAGAISFIRDGDRGNAKATLDYCASLDPSQCDVWITYAAAGGGVAEGEVLRRIIATKNSVYGCFSQLTDGHVQVIMDNLPHLLLGFAGLRTPLVSTAGIDLAYAASLALDRQFSSAYEALSGLQGESALLLRTWLYHTTSRFTDVLHEARSLVGSDDSTVATYASLFLGIAHAHLGNFDAARDHLISVMPTEAVRVDAEAAAEAAYWIALTWREEADQQLASQYLQRAISLSPQHRFQAALDNSDIRIRLTRGELIDRRTSRWDVGSEPTLAQAQSQEMASKRGGLLEEGLFELETKIIGMDHVKHVIKRWTGYMRGLQQREAKGLRAKKASKHLIFAGPPGTGKTTIAAIVAKIAAGLGLIATEKFRVASRANLVGEYSGQTAPKTNAVLEDALDGVLFLDEAYALVADTGTGGTKDSFGAEAVTEILAFMENYRDRLIVIIAGYNDDIDRLLATNEGWSTRFTTRIDFASYTIDELIELAQLWCEEEEYILPDEAVEFLRTKARALYADHGPSGRKVIDELGNGRFIRNLMESASEIALGDAMDTQLAGEVDDDALQMLTVASIEQAFDELTRKALGGKAT
ncbi:AAA family ATPase [Mycobacterium intracellulare]|uniref:AAA family ATPase n=1 Tax=Mycobacterium intracellulare TaxID=1767 RepID=UPI001EECFD05|nr:AAA family ATPase [Mycobacterium intracellulare]MEE3755271.1 AAA family ATPase [Mycobacterium intracellulare]